MPLIRSQLPLLSIAALVGLAATAQAQFEGTVTMRMSAGRGPNEMTYSVKHDKIRMDIASPMGAMYIIRAGEKSEVVIPAQHMYIEQATPIDATMMPNRAGNAAPSVDIKFTGRKEIIAGYECEHAIISGQDGEYDVCLAKGLGSFMAPSNPMARGGDNAPAAGALKKLGGNIFPLKVQKVGGDVVLEVTKLEKKSLDDSVFSVPSDFKKMDLSGLMGRPPGGI
jgi:hypothetical protein